MYNSVKELQAQKLNINQARRRLGINFETAKRIYLADSFPGRAPRRRHSQVDQFDLYLRERWAGGCQNARQLYHELCARGYRGSSVTIRRHVQEWRGERARAADVELSPIYDPV